MVLAAECGNDLQWHTAPYASPAEASAMQRGNLEVAALHCASHVVFLIRVIWLLNTRVNWLGGMGILDSDCATNLSLFCYQANGGKYLHRIFRQQNLPACSTVYF